MVSFISGCKCTIESGGKENGKVNNVKLAKDRLVSLLDQSRTSGNEAAADVGDFYICKCERPEVI